MYTACSHLCLTTSWLQPDSYGCNYVNRQPQPMRSDKRLRPLMPTEYRLYNHRQCDSAIYGLTGVSTGRSRCRNSRSRSSGDQTFFCRSVEEPVRDRLNAFVCVFVYFLRRFSASILCCRCCYMLTPPAACPLHDVPHHPLYVSPHPIQYNRVTTQPLQIYVTNTQPTAQQDVRNICRRGQVRYEAQHRSRGCWLAAVVLLQQQADRPCQLALRGTGHCPVCSWCGHPVGQLCPEHT